MGAPEFWLLNAAVESPLTAIKQHCCSSAENFTICAAKWLQKTKSVLTGNGLVLASTKKRNAAFNNTTIMIHDRGVDKALVAE